MDLETANNDWHISLHFSDGPLESETITHKEREKFVVKITADQLRNPFPAEFDAFVASVNSMPGGFAEGDGSFGLVGPSGVWKISGNIYEREDQIHYAELIGVCPENRMLEIVELLGATANTCLVQDMQGGFFQTIQQFFSG